MRSDVRPGYPIFPRGNGCPLPPTTRRQTARETTERYLPTRLGMTAKIAVIPARRGFQLTLTIKGFPETVVSIDTPSFLMDWIRTCNQCGWSCCAA